MTRYLAGPSDSATTVANTGGYFRPKSGTLTFWDAQSGGTQYADCSTDAAGTQLVSSVTSDASGRWSVYYPDEVTGAWVDDGDSGTPRVWVEAIGLPAATNSTVAGFVNGAGTTKDALSSAYAALPATAPDATEALNLYFQGPTKVAGWTTSDAVIARSLGWMIVTDKQYAGGADPTNAASSTAAFDAAIAAANTAGGNQRIYVPAGTYDLTAGLVNAIITNYVTFVGAGMGATTLRVTSGTLFTFGDGGTSTVIGGGLSHCDIVATAAIATQQVVKISGASSQKFEWLSLDSIMQLALLGTSETAAANATSFSHIYGNTANVAGSVVIDAAHGGSLSLEEVVVNAKGVTIPTDRTTLSDAAATTFLRYGQGSWDTTHASKVYVNRYDRGLDINIDSGAYAVRNMWFYGCVFDYSKSNGIRLRTAIAGANISSLYFLGGWAVAIDGYSVECNRAGNGTFRNIYFTNVVARQAGKNNWRFLGDMEKVYLTECHSLGANRLSTNTSTDQDDTILLGNGVTVRGGSFGEDGTSYVGYTAQGRYGMTIGADTSNVVTGVMADGVTGGFQGGTSDTTVDRRRLITGNRRATADAQPEYATVINITPSASGVTATHYYGTHAMLYIYGGTCSLIQQNGITVGTTGPASLALKPGDTWSVTYTAAPTVRRVTAP